MRRLLTALFVVLAAPSAAWGGDVRFVSRDVPLASSRALAASQAPIRFNVVGLHWRGSGSVLFRTRTTAGRWSAWRPAAPEAEDGPDPGSGEARRARGWRIGNPYWTDTSDRIQYRLEGRVRRLRAHFVWSPVELVPYRSLALASSPRILPRVAWQANERIRRGPPLYARAVRFALVHHTAGSNTYTRAQSAAIVRAIEVYHVRGNGWNDIAYNFLVDKYGQIFEGRYGGITRNVVGAHAQGFNTGSVGVSLLGNYESSAPPPPALTALARLLAWRLDVAHVDPLSSLIALSLGNPRFPAGAPVVLRAIGGHRDVGFTACPGNRLYGRIPATARAAARIGLPKLYAPTVRGRLGERVRFAARLSSSLRWTVTVRDSAGATVASGSGAGARVAWTWDAALVPRDRYTWTIEAPGVRAARGSLGARPRQPPVALLSEVAASPTTVTPNDDGESDYTTIRYRLGADALVEITLLDEAGTSVATLLHEAKPAGRHSLRFAAATLVDGRYTVVVEAETAEGRRARASVAIVVSRLLRRFSVAPTAFSPNGDGVRDRVLLDFALVGAASVRLQIRQRGRALATPFEESLPIGEHRIAWDGSTPSGRLRDGRYQAVLRVADERVAASLVSDLRQDTIAPRLALVSLRPPRVRVSERGELRISARGRRVTRAVRAGVIGLSPRLRGSVLVARDEAGNRSRALRLR